MPVSFSLCEGLILWCLTCLYLLVCVKVNTLIFDMPLSFGLYEGLIIMTCLFLSVCVKAFVVAEAYGKTVDWSDSLLAHVLLSGDMRYLQELKTYVKLTPSLIESTLYK